MNQTVPLVTDKPEYVILLDELMNKGELSRTDIESKLGPYKTKKALLFFENYARNIAVGLKEYFKDPIRGEFEFIKVCLGFKDGRRRVTYQLGENIEVKKIPGNSRMLIYREPEVIKR